MEARILHRRLLALLLGIAVAAFAVSATFVLLPAQDVRDQHTDYGYVYSGAKSSSTDFIHANMGDDTLLVLGSSEFSTPKSLVPQVPAATFGEHNYGKRFMLVGEAFDQCLWDTMALGAIAKDGVPQNKVALIIGLGMFTDGGLDASSFSARFSYSLYRGFCSNRQIPEEVRQKVADRLAQQGVDDTTIRAGAPQNPLDAIDGVVLSGIDDLSIRSKLADVRSSGIPLADSPAEQPNWDALREQALEDAKRMSTNNEWGVEDKFYEEQLSPALPSLKDARAEETYSNTPEYDDLDLFLQTCDACGIEPLIVIEPTLAPYYDYIGIGKDKRDAAYDRIREVVARHPSARLADFSDHEYEPYYLFDIVHFGWTGWIDAEKALYEFATEGN